MAAGLCPTVGKIVVTLWPLGRLFIYGMMAAAALAWCGVTEAAADHPADDSL
jgi:hypothetical protein